MPIETIPDANPGGPQQPATAAELRLLVVEDSEADFDLLVHTLARQGLRCRCERVESAAAMQERLATHEWDAIVSDHHLPSFSSTEAFELLRASGLDLPFIIVSGTIGEDAAVAAMRLGADDYLIKGRLARLGPALHNAIAATRTRRSRHEAEAALARSERALHALSLHLLEAIEAERARIARDIHDDIGSGLTALQYDLAWITRHGDAPSAERAAFARSQVSELMQTAQRLIRNLRPPVLDAGLSAAVDWLVRRFRERCAIAVRLQMHGDDERVPQAAALVCYRTLQEALTNVARHSGARSVTVGLVIGEQAVSLEVSDDGVGIASQDRDKPTSFGLRGLAERLSQHEGWLETSANPGGGTTLLMSIPLDGAATRAASEAAP